MPLSQPLCICGGMLVSQVPTYRSTALIRGTLVGCHLLCFSNPLCSSIRKVASNSPLAALGELIGRMPPSTSQLDQFFDDCYNLVEHRLCPGFKALVVVYQEGTI